MIWHVIGWTTFVVTLLCTGLGVEAMRVACRDSRSWRRPLVVPKFSAVPLTLSRGSDYVGLV